METYSYPGSISDLTRALVLKSLEEFKKAHSDQKDKLLKQLTSMLEENYETHTGRFKHYVHAANIFLRIITLYKLK